MATLLTSMTAEPTNPVHLASHLALTEVRDHRMVVVVDKYVGGLEVVSKRGENTMVNGPKKSMHTFKSP